MKIFNRKKGAEGEALAKKYLAKKKYKILEQNYKNKVGEIDIIAKDRDFLVFIEVKNRSTAEFGMPSEAVDARKQQKIRLTSEVYLKINHLSDVPCRFDVVEVLGDEINHIIDAF